jgi:hypothetical protein
VKIKINYEVNGYSDSYILESDTVEEIKTLNRIEMEKRRLDEIKNNCYSEVIH